MGDLGHLSRVGVAPTVAMRNPYAATGWVVLHPRDLLPKEPFEVWHGAARGPGGTFLVFIDDQFYGVGQNGRINEYGPKIPMFVNPGQDIFCYWSIGTGTAPVVDFRFRTPEVGRI